MKFQGRGLEKMKEFYHEMKERSKSGKNPLNEDMKFEKSYMTDFLQGLVNFGYNLRAIKIQHGWLELDSIKDHELYTKMKNNNTLTQLINL